MKVLYTDVCRFWHALTPFAGGPNINLTTADQALIDSLLGDPTSLNANW